MPTKTNKSTSKKVEKITCNICGKEQAGGNYYTSDREEFSYLGGKAPFCKKCLNVMIVDTNVGKITIDKFKAAMKILDYPFVNSLYIEVINNENTNNSNMLGRYIKAINLKPEFKNTGYSDTVRFEIQEQQIMNSKIEEELKNDITDDVKRFWGRGLDNQDYMDLQAMFDSFTEHEESMDYKKESDYKSLCVYELQKSKLQFDVDKISQVEKLQKMIDTLSDNLGIQAIQKQDAFDNNKFVLGLITRYYEDVKKEPIKRWVEDLGNLDPLRDIIKTDYLAGMATALGISNPEIEDAKKRLEEFSVKLEEIYEDDTSEEDE